MSGILDPDSFSGTGGSLVLNILDDLEGDVDCPNGALFLVSGNVTSTASISLGSVAQSRLWLNYNVELSERFGPRLRFAEGGTRGPQRSIRAQ